MCLGSIAKCLRDSMGLHYDKFEDFFEPTCIACRPLYVLYRVTWSAFFVSVLLHDIMQHVFLRQGLKWFLYLTHWTFLLVTVHTTNMAIGVLKVKGKFKDIPLAPETRPAGLHLIWMKATWAVNTMTYDASLTIGLLYWAAIYDGQPASLANVTMHVMTSLFVLTELCVSRVPVRALHFYLPMLYTILYLSCTALYCALGGTNKRDQPFIYPVIDYGEHPVRAVLFIGLGIFVVLPIIHFVVYGLYRLKMYLIRRRAIVESETENETTIVNIE